MGRKSAPTYFKGNILLGDELAKNNTWHFSYNFEGLNQITKQCSSPESYDLRCHYRANPKILSGSIFLN